MQSRIVKVLVLHWRNGLKYIVSETTNINRAVRKQNKIGGK